MKYLSALLLLTACAATPPTEGPPPDGLPTAIEATAALVEYDEAGGDFRSYCAGVIHRDQILTAAHCVDEEGAEHLVSFWSERMGMGHFDTAHRYAVIHFDTAQDFAVLGPLSTFRPPGRARLGPEPFRGQTVVVIGHPLGLDWTVTEGVVSDPRRVIDRGPMEGMVFMQVSAPVYFGNSGGPVFNRRGEIVGIVSFLAAVPHLAGAVPLETIEPVVGQ